MFILKIKKLGSLADSEIEVKPFTLFFGENNLNKSYTLALIYLIGKILSKDALLSELISSGGIEPIWEKLEGNKKYTSDELDTSGTVSNDNKR